jgi:trehalose 6-phosphate synthase/phosphatase
MNRLLVVSNRLPVNVQKRRGEVHFSRSVGGVATGLASFYESYNSLWVGWPGISLSEMRGEKTEVKKRLMSEFSCYPVFLSPNDIDKYYHGFSNKTLWPLCHYFNQYVVHDQSFWQAYKRVNRHFCEAVLEIAQEGDIIWVHDYHLTLLPKLLREKLPEVAIGYFHHIPFPSFELFRLLPWRTEILEGLLGADVIGFHTYDYARHFLSSVHRLLGCEYSMGQITVGDRVVRVDAFPMGIDYERFSGACGDAEVKKEINKFRKQIQDRRLILSIDRLDYTKGIPQRLEAFQTFLEKNPEYREKVIFILVAVPSRSQVEHYRLLKTQVDGLAGKINGEYGTIGWMPIWYLYRLLHFPTLAALYCLADIAVVTPLRDGMNLIAKEYVATKRGGRGVLILSEMAGAAKELGEAIIVNPNNIEEVAEALEKALAMPEGEQEERNKVMQKRIKRYNVVRWSEEFINRLIYTKRLQKELRAKILTSQMQRKLVADYGKGNRRLLLLDYDGTLVPFYGEPEKAKPQEELLKLLRELAENPKNEVVLVSGRYKDNLERWFGKLKVGLVAEHGVWLKDNAWQMIEPLTNEWKEEIQQIFELSTDRTPGSFIEEKDYSLVWHYRKADPELSSMRVRELIDELVNLTANLNLQVLEGSKVVEIKNMGVNKGRAALRWIAKEDWDFVLAVGDDWTDEDLFGAVPGTAYSIKVGLRPSLARFNLETPGAVLSLLKELAAKG